MSAGTTFEVVSHCDPLSVEAAGEREAHAISAGAESVCVTLSSRAAADDRRAINLPLNIRSQPIILTALFVAKPPQPCRAMTAS